MAVPTTVWSELTPAGSSNISLGDNRIREMKTQIREVISADHEFTSTQTASTGGQHKKVTLQEQADLGTGAVGTTILGNQTVAGEGELVYTDEGDTDVQITSLGKLCTTSLTTVASISTILNLIYPIGFVVTLGVSTNPGTLFGVGTWTAVTGTVIVGKAAAGTFDTLDATGGAETINIAHTHSTNLGSEELDGSGGGTTVAANTGATDSDSKLSATQSVLQPYIVKYVWQRTA